MTTCKSCDGKGYIEYDVQRDGGLKGNLRKCHTCKDDEKYSREVSRRYAQKPLTAKLFEIKSARKSE